MGTQRKISLDVQLFGPRWFLLASVLLATVLVLPALSLDSLLCFHCPLQQKGKSCPNITSQCLPHQRCSSARGHYGSVHILSSQGCVDAELCGSHEMASFLGVEYNISHTCCCKDQCNEQPTSDSNLKKLLMIADAMDHSDVPKEDLWDSCANHTASTSATSPAAAA